MEDHKESRNQYYNKLKAQLQSNLKSESRTSQRIQALTYHRNRFVENYLHNTSRLIVNRLKQQGIGTLVIGKNEGWKQQVHKGKRNNQKESQYPSRSSHRPAYLQVRTGRYQSSQNRGKLHVKNVSY
ncbi:MAG: transposase [Coleofasciculus sp. C2-GNP5-27]